MAKLAALSALLLLAMVGLAAATTYTTITTTTIDEEAVTNTRGRGRERCEEQIRVQQISHCGMLVQCEGRSPRYHESLRMVVNPASTRSECEEKHLEMCCQQLHNVKEECRCKTIEQMMQERTQQSREMMKMAQDLPMRCNMEPRRCDMQGPWF